MQEPQKKTGKRIQFKFLIAVQLQKNSIFMVCQGDALFSASQHTTHTQFDQINIDSGKKYPL